VSTVFILWHSHPTGGGEMNEKLIGVYATESDASRAIDRIKVQSGFRDYLEGFEIIRYEIGKDHWEEGYFTD
jgi:hypothetical protein